MYIISKLREISMKQNVEVPKSIKRISSSVAVYVRVNYPNVYCIKDVDALTQAKWEASCDHEMYYQDINRFMGDVYTQKTMEN